MFGLGKIELIVIGAMLLVAVTGGVIAHIYNMGSEAEAGKVAAESLKETEDARKLREANDAKAGSLDDARALACLRNPSGCR